MSVLNALKHGACIMKNFMVKNGPKIAIFVGSGLVVGGTVDACRKTLQAPKLLEEHNEKMESIRKATELDESGNDFKYDESIRRRDTMIVYRDTAVGFAKLFWRPTALIVGGFTSLFWGVRIIDGRRAAAILFGSQISDQFNAYRGNVQKELGSEADQRFLTGEVSTEPEKKILEIPKKDGNEDETEAIEVEKVDLSAIDKDAFTFVFNYKSAEWKSHWLYNHNMFEELRRHYQNRFDRGLLDHVFVGDVYKKLGIGDPNRDGNFDKEMLKKLSYGPFYGWVNRPGAIIDIKYTPYVELFSVDEADNQFPMTIEIDKNDPAQFEFFKKKYGEDERQVGYILEFKVDTDENGIPKQIYNTVYGV